MPVSRATARIGCTAAETGGGRRLGMAECVGTPLKSVKILS